MISDEKGRVERLDQLIKQLPKVNYDNLWFVVENLFENDQIFFLKLYHPFSSSCVDVFLGE